MNPVGTYATTPLSRVLSMDQDHRIKVSPAAIHSQFEKLAGFGQDHGEIRTAEIAVQGEQRAVLLFGQSVSEAVSEIKGITKAGRGCQLGLLAIRRNQTQ